MPERKREWMQEMERGGWGARGWWEINDLSRSVPHSYRAVS